MRKVVIILLTVAAVFTVHAQNGTIRELTGDVQLKPAGASDFSPARSGSQVSQDTVISTGFRSTALITIGSSEITVRPLTRLTLAEITSAEGTESLNVNLQTGRVKVDVKPPAGTKAATTVRSPSATASVRGTSFEMDTRNITVTDGNVNWRDSNGLSAAVTVGFSSSIGGMGGIVDPVEIAEADLTVAAPAGAGDSGESSGTTVIVNEPTDGNVNVGTRW